MINNQKAVNLRDGGKPKTNPEERSSHTDVRDGKSFKRIARRLVSYFICLEVRH